MVKQAKKAAATKAKPKAPAKKPAAKTVRMKTTIGGTIKAEILKGTAVAEIVPVVKGLFPKAKTTEKCVYFYRSQLHKTGELARKA